MKVAIFAGGKGSRLIEETKIRPKPLVEIGQRPLLWHIMQHYSTYGHHHFVLALGYMGEHIKKYIAELSQYEGNLRIDFANREILGQQPARNNFDVPRPPWLVDLIDTGIDSMTGWRLQLMRPYLDGETFMLTYGDGLSNVNIEELLAFHRSHGKLATMTMVNPLTTFGHLNYDDSGRVLGFEEKPDIAPSLINGGFFVLEPGIFDVIEEKNDPGVMWEQAPLNTLMEMGELMAYQHKGFWSCCDHLADKRRLEDMWNSGDRPWATWLEGSATNRHTASAWKSDSPGIGRGSHPGDWIHYRSI